MICIYVYSPECFYLLFVFVILELDIFCLCINSILELSMTCFFAVDCDLRWGL